MWMDLEIGPCLPGWSRRNDKRSSTIHPSIITACLVDDEDFLKIDSWGVRQFFAIGFQRQAGVRLGQPFGCLSLCKNLTFTLFLAGALAVDHAHVGVPLSS